VTLEKLHSTLVSLGSDRELVGGLFRDGNGVPEILLHPRLFRQMTARDKEQPPSHVDRRRLEDYVHKVGRVEGAWRPGSTMP